jgi:exodeoxyribonuclease VII large subunit
MEDLACFNDEALARTIAASQLPVVTAIGHETDFTIADFVADLRAPTPSAAAELVTAAQHRIEERIDALTTRVHRAGRYHLMHARQRYSRLSAESVLQRLRDAVNRRDQHLDELRLRVEAATQRRLRLPAQRLALLTERLRRQDVTVRVANVRHRLHRAEERLQRTAVQIVALRADRLKRVAARLDDLSPVAVLSRGYALVYSADGRLLRSASDTSPGETIHARLGQGRLEAKVTGTDFNEPETTEISHS